MRSICIIFIFLFLPVCAVNAQVMGCTDPMAKNYNPLATVNDGSCKYASVSVSPTYSAKLPSQIKETSGLVKWNDHLYTLNDDGDTNLYAIESSTGAILEVLPLPGTVNQDWEELAQDEGYFYIGDFGNNVDGNRTNLNILRVGKMSLLSGSPEIDRINFTYPDQTNFKSKGSNNSDFDCEAFIITRDSIYLFTKQWVSKKTSVYVLPKIPGTYTASRKTGYDVSGLITGATWVEDKRLLLLSGYNGILQPFIYLLYDFKDLDFFSGNKRKISLSISFHQTEGIATINGTDVFVTNEQFAQQPFVSVTQKLHKFDLSPYLSNYLENYNLVSIQNNFKNLILTFPSLTRDIVYIDIAADLISTKYSCTDNKGKQVLEGVLDSKTNKINISSLIPGVYTLLVEGYPDYAYKFVKR
ncbi:T9SS C-terminal target domain-containing protein [Flavobacterium cerinum]|uniref:T9SS C-terminal target domain-containing protein n=1 Tax=Flavobacterium cerinum TaxID=2502784 RepID=A0A444GMG8_9FLAO|nr:T9SS C-terminal target domain-containing protein [Flavobacterium cerinum]RWW92153.1 T9SS C-terminal target domain-containing protein [Flavobacterium cerinum]